VHLFLIRYSALSAIHLIRCRHWIRRSSPSCRISPNFLNFPKFLNFPSFLTYPKFLKFLKFFPSIRARDFRRRSPCLILILKSRVKRLSRRSIRFAIRCLTVISYPSASRCLSFPSRSCRLTHSSCLMSLMNPDRSCFGRSPYVLPPSSGALITQ